MISLRPTRAGATSGTPTARLAVAVPLLAALVAVTAALPPATAAEATAQPEADTSRWLPLGSFRGTASSDLAQEAKNYLFGVEQDGDLYRDLGNLSLGLGYSSDDFNLKWDNSFLRQVEPWHQELPLGETLTAGDLSSFVDVQGTISRVRLSYGVPTDLTGDFGVGVNAERGWTLTLARARKPLVFGERPLEEVLAERDVDHLRELIQRPPWRERDLIDLTAVGVANLARRIAQGVSTSADTERGTIFYENAADPIRLMTDVGIPLPFGMFTAGDPRMAVGDRARQITFVSLSPITGGIGEFGLAFGYEAFSRFLRETTIVKEADNHVLVSVRHARMRGHELTPLRFRPEVRLLSIIGLGYTFFDSFLSRGGTASSGLAYRIDLSDPQGRRAFEALLDEGIDIRYRPLQVAADRGEGAELLAQEVRRGSRRGRVLRIRLFSPFSFLDTKTAFSDEVRVGEVEFREMGVARIRRLRKRIGRNRDWQKQFLVSSQGSLGADGEAPAGGGPPIAVTLLTGFRNQRADGVEVRRQANLLIHSLGAHPVLEALAAVDEDEQSDFFASLRVSLGREQLIPLRDVEENRVWTELAEILLGPDHAGAWATAAERSLWKKRRHRRSYGELLADDLASLPQPRPKRLSMKDRFRLARKTVTRFEGLRRLLRELDCLSCLSRAFDRERDIVLLQMLVYRLASELVPVQPGYDLEIFGGDLLSPVTLTNGIRHGFETGVRSFEEVAGYDASVFETGTEQAIRRVDQSQSVWGGAKTLVRGADARLRAADLLLYAESAAPGARPECLLRLYSDFRFAPELALRVDIRRSKTVTADISEATHLIPFGEPDEVFETPFATARYYYDLPLVPSNDLLEGEDYTLLLRALNPDGRPVSEEQQLRFTWPEAEELEALRASRNPS